MEIVGGGWIAIKSNKSFFSFYISRRTESYFFLDSILKHNLIEIEARSSVLLF